MAPSLAWDPDFTIKNSKDTGDAYVLVLRCQCRCWGLFEVKENVVAALACCRISP